MIRRPPRSTQGVSSAASDVYKRQVVGDYSQTLEEKETDTGDKKIEVKLGWKTKAEIVEGAEKVNTMEALQYQTSHSSSFNSCLLYTSPSPRDLSTSRMPSSA
eukprot:TRINITY_DN2373_c0_g1_i11.p1 TRINITY_DN2373_c0_g1~~TRINITY_DN2373_c0_g1_i11.p1  ORF type:complete len:103 (+),score=29.95 TRINITY_DN2373_c0_g1_i11:109-417(+)